MKYLFFTWVSKQLCWKITGRVALVFLEPLSYKVFLVTGTMKFLKILTNCCLPLQNLFMGSEKGEFFLVFLLMGNSSVTLSIILQRKEVCAIQSGVESH